MVVFGFAESLVTYFEKVLVLKEDFTLGLGYLHTTIFFLQCCTIVREGEGLRKVGDFDFGMSVEGLGDKKGKYERDKQGSNGVRGYMRWFMRRKSVI